MMKDTSQNEWNNNAIIIPSNHSEQLESHGNLLKVVVPTSVTNNQFGLYEIEMQAGARGPKLHYHKLMDETFIVHEGTLTVLTAEGELQANAGTVIFVPRGSVHGYHNNTECMVKMTMIFNPGLHREEFFRKMYRMLEDSPDDLVAFQQLYLKNDSYSLLEKDMIPMSN
jgi:quercetin dioxygenase-like cupin family protein